MKNFLISLVMCAMLVGCAGTNGPTPPKTIPPLPVVNDTDAVSMHAQDAFSCDGEKPIGMKSAFTIIDGMTGATRYFMSFQTFDNTLILIEYVGPAGALEPGQAWVDLGADRHPEFYFEKIQDLPGFPNICQYLDTLKTQ